MNLDKIFTPQVEERLLALEQIGEFFGSSLKPADMFRLIASRLSEIIPNDGCFLFQGDRSAAGLKLVYAAADDPSRFIGLTFDARRSVAGQAIKKGCAVSDISFPAAEKFFPRHFASAIAAPLGEFREGTAVLALASRSQKAFSKGELLLLEASAERISSLVRSAFNNQHNSHSSLIDLLTELPNEAAFFLMLEQQIAEAQRFSQKEDLTVLCMDIKDFAQVNEKHGHAVGDQMLTFAARIIKNQLRQMDFLARPSADEFWAILPGASADIVELVIERLDRAFVHSRFTPAEPHHTIDIELHFGTATLKKDGMTALEIVQCALRRKNEEKDPLGADTGSIIPFPIKAPTFAQNPF
jgi:diguanylate cyclase (GGDEF)-like protein